LKQNAPTWNAEAIHPEKTSLFYLILGGISARSFMCNSQTTKIPNVEMESTSSLMMKAEFRILIPSHMIATRNIIHAEATIPNPRKSISEKIAFQFDLTGFFAICSGIERVKIMSTLAPASGRLI